MALELIPITLREANGFVQSFHRHSGITTRYGGKFAIGAAEAGQLMAVAVVGRPLARMLNDSVTAEVLRVCARPDAPRNCNSFLYGACWRAWRAMGGKRIVTYTLQEESGESLRGAGWKVIAELKSRKGWDTRNRERNWQPVYGKPKYRWEQVLSMVSGNGA
jgi:hypothetical protein